MEVETESNTAMPAYTKPEVEKVLDAKKEPSKRKPKAPMKRRARKVQETTPDEERAGLAEVLAEKDQPSEMWYRKSFLDTANQIHETVERNSITLLTYLVGIYLALKVITRLFRGRK